MTRKTAREIAVHLAYELGFCDCSVEDFLSRQLTVDSFHLLAQDESLYEQFPDAEQLDYFRRVILGVGAHGYELESDIERYSVGWKFSRIPRVATAIMRVAMYEILYMPEIPNAAAINEAVEIAHNYEDDKVVSFINGVLGTFVRTLFPEDNV